MTYDERHKIYNLLSKFFPNSKQLKDSETRTAWGLVLENYTYDDVKSAVLRYVVKNKYFPDICDLTAGLTPVEVLSEEEEETSARWLTPKVAAIIRKMDDEYAERMAREGGPCQLRSLRQADRDAGESMVEGLFLRRHYPTDCVGCKRLAIGAPCQYEVMTAHIDTERQNCLILTRHGGEGHQSAVLKKYWKDLCYLCDSDCFWPEGMQVVEESEAEEWK